MQQVMQYEGRTPRYDSTKLHQVKQQYDSTKLHQGTRLVKQHAARLRKNASTAAVMQQVMQDAAVLQHEAASSSTKHFHYSRMAYLAIKGANKASIKDANKASINC
jgi:hypothetical protein